jgi:tRNA (guanine10-N2)-dimethyltransferase
VKIILELSGEHPGLPCGEIYCICSPILFLPRLVLADCPDISALARLSLTHTASEYLGQSPSSLREILALVRSLSLSAGSPFAVRARKIQGDCSDASQQELERLVGGCISGRVDLKNPVEEYRVIISGGTCLFGRKIYQKDPAGYAARRPKTRPFFHPGVMMPGLARALVNLSRVMPGEILLDPFCGTGGVLIEAGLIGTMPVGIDVDRSMVEGSHLNCPLARVILADATALPFSDDSVDAVVTDLPYGQSVIIHADTLETLYHDALAEIARVLRPGRTAVIVTHRDISRTAAEILPIRSRYEQRVHKSLTRRILVLEKNT